MTVTLNLTLTMACENVFNITSLGLFLLNNFQLQFFSFCFFDSTNAFYFFCCNEEMSVVIGDSEHSLSFDVAVCSWTSYLTSCFFDPKRVVVTGTPRGCGEG